MGRSGRSLMSRYRGHCAPIGAAAADGPAGEVSDLWARAKLFDDKRRLRGQVILEARCQQR